MGVCEFVKDADTKWLYTFGGVTRVESNPDPKLLDEVERLYIGENSLYQWEILSFKLNNPVCDIGSFQLNSHQILLFGGWDKNKLSSVSTRDAKVVELEDGEIINSKDGHLDQHDYFLGANPIIKESESVVAFIGQLRIHKLDLKNMHFGSVAIVKS